MLSQPFNGLFETGQTKKKTTGYCELFSTIAVRRDCQNVATINANGQVLNKQDLHCLFTHSQSRSLTFLSALTSLM